MPRILAIDWDRREARALLLHSGPTGTSVAGGWATPLDSTDGSNPTSKHVGERLAAAMAGQPGGKVVTIVGTGRDHVQMKLLSLPPAPDDELPEMVRFQAERELTNLGSDAALDFISLSGDSQTPYQVLAIALGPAGIAEAREVCQALNVELDHLALRTCAPALLATRAGAATAENVALIINPLIDEADLTVLADDHVILMRTVRLPEPDETDARDQALIGQVRRTVAAARQQLGDRQVDRLLYCGSAAESALTATLSSELEMPVTLIEPAANAPAGFNDLNIPADRLGRFAGVLGMALGEADRLPPIIDFLNVRKRVERARFGRIHILAGAAAAAALLLVGAYFWRQSANLSNELAETKREIQEIQKSVKQHEKVVARAAAVERWLATDVNWLDEMEQFSRDLRPKAMSEKDFPAEQDVVVTQVTLGRPPGVNATGGKVDLTAVAKTATAVAELETRLRDEQHSVTTGIGQQDRSVPGYDWSFGLQVNVTPAEAAPEAKP